MLGIRAGQLDLDGGYQVPLATKTPGKNKRENAILPATVHGKARTLISQTPYKPGTIQPERVKDAGTRVTKTPFGDKTPFPNRLRPQFFTPSQDGPKIQKPSFLLEVVPDGTPGSALRPSSTRKNMRSRRSSTKAFETPMNKGNPWDVLEDDLMSPENSVQEVVEEEEFDFDEEIEYMPPNTLDLPYVPPFDFEMPDYKKVGAAVTEIMHSYAYEDTAPPPDPTIDEKDLIVPMERLLPLEIPEDEDDPFVMAKQKPVAPAPKPAGLARAASAASSRLPSTSRAPSTLRGTATHSRTASATTTLPPRPATASSMRRPAQPTRPAPLMRARSGTVSTAAPATKPRLAGVAPVSRRPVATNLAPADRTHARSGSFASTRSTVRVTGPAGRLTSGAAVKKVQKDEDPFKFDINGPIGEDFMFEV
ncbi:hypothetical protein BD626DRAFT_580435 [Schizophyllum amplum]|uniref:Uncharacterized protein n=1 Tax=Schizophyllum amplum TaxID=97359 RepID=A0A550CZX8_9AGAR|nr:hypothetical protein BD626DRAFT_580435 [Auriculariopsis ampla]